MSIRMRGRLSSNVPRAISANARCCLTSRAGQRANLCSNAHHLRPTKLDHENQRWFQATGQSRQRRRNAHELRIAFMSKLCYTLKMERRAVAMDNYRLTWWT